MLTILVISMFVSSLILDIAWVRWTKSVVKDEKWYATMWSGTYYSVAMIQAYFYVNDPRLILPSVMGHMAGTWLTLKFFAERKTRDSNPQPLNGASDFQSDR